MSDEMRLPEELAACEARLASLALPAVGIDRDALLYRAGWEAALAEFAAAGGVETARRALSGSPPSPRRAGERTRGPRLRTAVWSLASAAAAASVAVAATLYWQPERVVEVVVRTETPVRAPAEPTPPAPRKPSSRADAPPAWAALPLPGKGGLLDLRQQALAGAWPERTRTATVTAEPTPSASAKTVRELMHELLPQPVSLKQQPWPWSRLAPGETI